MNSEPTTRLGLIGGSGLYDIEGLEDVRDERVSTPWGDPSEALRFGRIGDVEVVFIAAPWARPPLSPSDINFRANIDALKRVGVTDIISLSACGSLREHLTPGMFVLVDQFIDRTFAREKSFFGSGLVAHVSMAHPVCPLVDASSTPRGRGYPRRAAGPIWRWKARSSRRSRNLKLYRSWGCDVIGMTNMPEAKLAREAELPYATVAMVTDYDCWHPDHDDVTVDAIVRVLHENADKARALVRRVAPLLGPVRQPSPLGIETCLDDAIITAPTMRDPAMIAKLDAVAGRAYALYKPRATRTRHGYQAGGSNHSRPSETRHHVPRYHHAARRCARFRRVVDELVQPYAGARIDKVAGIEARGFILGGAVAHQLSVGFTPVRKKGKLPWRTLAQDYALEYGADMLKSTKTPSDPATVSCWLTTSSPPGARPARR